MKPITGIENLKASRVSRTTFCLEWTWEGHRYEIGLHHRTFKLHDRWMGAYVENRGLYREPVGGARRGWDKKHMNHTLPRNKAMIDAATAAAKSAHLFERCDAGQDEQSLAEVEAKVRMEQIRSAAPQMLRALQLALPALELGKEYAGDVLDVAASVRAAIHAAAGRRPNKLEDAC